MVFLFITYIDAICSCTCMQLASMVRRYQRKSSRGSYSQEAVEKALDAVKNNMPWNTASVTFGVPRTTLIRRMKVKKVPTSLGRFMPVFSDEFHNELVMHVVEMQNRFYGLSIHDLRSIAYELAERNGIKHPFSAQMRLAGKDWARCFLQRFPELSLRKPEATSMSRLTGFNRVQVNKFFDLLHNELETKKYSPKQIFNVDETGITTVQVPGKILACKGAKQVGRVVSGERGCTTTVVCAMSANGFYVPPVFLFKRKNMNDRLLRNCPPGSVGFPSPTGWIDSSLFVRYLQHFITCVQPRESSPVLLILDGHCSHKSIEAIELARQNHITMLTIPPHTSHRLQPLDLTFFGPLKTNYNRQADKWMLSNPGKRITDYELCEIFTPAYQQVASIDKAVKGFKCSGIMPYDPDVFSDEDFAPATVTEQPLIDTPVHTQPVSMPSSAPKKKHTKIKPGSGTVTSRTPTGDDVEPCTSSTPDSSVHVLDISPYPRVSSACNSGRKRHADVSAVLTSTPHKKVMEEKLKTKTDRKTAKPVAQKRLHLSPGIHKKTDNKKLIKGQSKRHQGVTDDVAESDNNAIVNQSTPKASRCKTGKKGSKCHNKNRPSSRRTAPTTGIRRPKLTTERSTLPRKPKWMQTSQQPEANNDTTSHEALPRPAADTCLIGPDSGAAPSLLEAAAPAHADSSSSGQTGNIDSSLGAQKCPAVNQALSSGANRVSGSSQTALPDDSATVERVESNASILVTQPTSPVTQSTSSDGVQSSMCRPIAMFYGSRQHRVPKKPSRFR
jgi:DDE superfamily endonuclease